MRRLQTSFGISGAPLDWFNSYLSARSRRVSILGALSDSLPPNSHCYVDDSQIYLSFKPDDLSSQQDAITATQNCIDDIYSWMEHDKLLNNEKTEFLVIGTRQQLSKVNISSITVGNSAIMKSSVVRNLGSYIDDKLSMNSHINKICNASFYYLHNIKRITKHLGLSPAD